jgi:hypothetical protein
MCINNPQEAKAQVHEVGYLAMVVQCIVRHVLAVALGALLFT